MKLVEHFDAFLNDTVNLNQDRIDTLEARVGTIQDFSKGSGYKARIRSFSEQGSWAHKTIIKPVKEDDEFDADLVVYVDPVEGWTARDYVLKLRQVFLASDRYEGMVSLKTRCVRLTYAGDFHLDIVPIVVRGNSCWVCNRNKDDFEQTDGDGYAEWWRGRDALTKGHLKRVTRLLKYLRDVKGTFSAKSVLLTTLIGERITGIDELLPRNFADVPTALRTVVNRLDDWLQENEAMPEVKNPAMREETFTRSWTPEQYENFRNKINQYRGWIDDAYNEPDRDESIRKWRRLFKEDFAKGETVDRATTAVARLAETIQRGQDLVAAVASYGRAVLDRMPHTFLHVEPSPYRLAEKQIPVRVTAYEKRTKDGARLRELQSGELIDAQSGIEFHALTNTGMPFARNYKVRWQVANTDKAAAAENCLRGEFYPSESHSVRFERTKYRGVHWVQAFVVNKRTGLRDGASERFFVVIR